MYFNTIKEVFENSDLNSDETIKIALDYVNFINTNKDLQEALKNILEINNQNAYDKLKQPWQYTGNLTLKGNQHTGKTLLYSLQPNRNLKINDLNISFLEDKDIDLELKIEKLKLLLDEWLNNGRVIWLSDNNDIPLDDLIYQLGLYHLNTVEKDDSFLLFGFELDLYYKPTWIDSGLVFYFNAQKTKNYGLTLNLLTGEDGLKEFISTKGKLVLKEVKVLRATKTMHLNKFSDTFRDNIIKKIEEKRG